MQSAQKELDALDDALFTHLDREILPLADNPRPAGCKKLKGYKGSVAHKGSVTDALVYIIDGTTKLIRITSIAHRREVYDR